MNVMVGLPVHKAADTMNKQEAIARIEEIKASIQSQYTEIAKLADEHSVMVWFQGPNDVYGAGGHYYPKGTTNVDGDEDASGWVSSSQDC